VLPGRVRRLAPGHLAGRHVEQPGDARVALQEYDLAVPQDARRPLAKAWFALGLLHVIASLVWGVLQVLGLVALALLVWWLFFKKDD